MVCPARSAACPTHAPQTPSAERAGIVRDFKRAWEAQDIGALVSVLDPDVKAIADGGGLASAVPLVEGRDAVSRMLITIAGRAGAPSVTLRERTVSGQPGLVMEQDGTVVTVIAFDMVDGRISRIWAVRNPAKLRPWSA